MFQTMGDASHDAITVWGHDLARELIGEVGFTDMVLSESTGGPPERAARAVLDAVLIALTENGPTPSAVAARLTDLGAPKTMQAAVAAGLLGDRFLESVGRLCPAVAGVARRRRSRSSRHRLAAVRRNAATRVPVVGYPTTHPDGVRGRRHGRSGRRRQAATGPAESPPRSTSTCRSTSTGRARRWGPTWDCRGTPVAVWPWWLDVRARSGTF